MSLLLVNSPNHMCHVGVIIFLQPLPPVTVIRVGVRNGCRVGHSWPFPGTFAILCRETESLFRGKAEDVCLQVAGSMFSNLGRRPIRGEE